MIGNETVDTIAEHLNKLESISYDKKIYIQNNIIDNNSWWFLIEEAKTSADASDVENKKSLIKDIASTIQDTERSLLIAVMSHYKEFKKTPDDMHRLVNYLLNNIDQTVLLPNIDTLKRVLLLLKRNSPNLNIYNEQVSLIANRLLELAEDLLPEAILFFRGMLPKEYRNQEPFKINEENFYKNFNCNEFFDKNKCSSVIEGQNKFEHSALLSYLATQLSSEQNNYIDTVRFLLESKQNKVEKYVTILFNVLEALQDKNYTEPESSAFYMQVMQLIAEKLPVMDLLIKYADDIPPDSDEQFNWSSIPLANRRIRNLLSSETATDWYSWLVMKGLEKRDAILYALETMSHKKGSAISVQDFQIDEMKDIFAEEFNVYEFKGHFSLCHENQDITNTLGYISVLRTLFLRQDHYLNPLIKPCLVQALSFLIQNITIESSLAESIFFAKADEGNSSFRDYLTAKAKSYENITNDELFLQHAEGLLNIVHAIYRQSQTSENYADFQKRLGDAMDDYHKLFSWENEYKMQQVYRQAQSIGPKNSYSKGEETINKIYSEIYGDVADQHEKKPEKLIEIILGDKRKKPSEEIKLIDEVLTNIRPEILLPDLEALFGTLAAWRPVCEAYIEMKNNTGLDESKRLEFKNIDALRDKLYKVIVLAAPDCGLLVNEELKQLKPLKPLKQLIRIPEDYYKKLLFSAMLKFLVNAPSTERSERLKKLLDDNPELIKSNFLSLETTLPSKKISLKEYLLKKINPNKYSYHECKHQIDVIDFLKLILEKDIGELNENEFLSKLETIVKKMGLRGTMKVFVTLYTELKCITKGSSNESKADERGEVFPKNVYNQRLSDMPRGTTTYPYQSGAQIEEKYDQYNDKYNIR